MSPSEPIRADHRFIQKLLGSSFGGKVAPGPEDFEMLTRVFRKVGGSWQRIFQGSPADITLLKLVLRSALDRSLLKKV